MESLPTEVVLRILHYLPFSDIWSTVCTRKQFRDYVNNQELARELIRYRWGDIAFFGNKDSLSLLKYLELAKRNYIEMIGNGHILSSAWKLKLQENPKPSNPPQQEVEYDDFGDEIRTQSVFEDDDFISQQASLYYDSYYVTFLADGPHFKVIFVDELLPENDVLLQIIWKEGAVSLYTEGDSLEVSPKSSYSIRQKYWVAITKDMIKVGKGKLGNDVLVEWNISLPSSPTHVGFAGFTRLVLTNVSGSGFNYLDTGLESPRSKIILNNGDTEMLTTSLWSVPCTHTKTVQCLLRWESKVGGPPETAPFTVGTYGEVTFYFSPEFVSMDVRKRRKSIVVSQIVLPQPLAQIWATFTPTRSRIGMDEVGENELAAVESNQQVSIVAIGAQMTKFGSRKLEVVNLRITAE